MRSRRIRGGGAVVALLALVFAVVPAVLRGGTETSELDGPERAVLVSLDTPAPGPPPADRPTPGSLWALVKVPDPDGRGALPPGLVDAVVDHVHALLAGPAADGLAGVGLPVQGVAGSGGPGSVDFAGTASPSETITITLPDLDWVVVISILRVVTTQPVTPPTTEPPPPTTEPTSTTTTTTEPASTTTTTTEPPSTSTTTSTEPPTTTTTKEPATTTTTGPPAGSPDPVQVPTTVHVSPQPLPGPRDPRVWPFEATSPWNTPLGDGATYDPRPVVPGPFNISAANGYGVSVGGAGYPLVDQPRGEYHYSIYRPDGVTVDEYYRYGQSNQNAMVTDARGDGVDVGWDTATRVSQLGGLIRAWDLQRGVIQHALHFAAAATILNSSKVWPATGVDGYAESNSGFVPYGSLFAIPKDAVMPSGLSPVGEMIWTALRDYGGYVSDAQGQVGLPTDDFTSIRAEATADPLLDEARGRDMQKIGAQLRWVTNANRNQVGGPGARLAPIAPDLAGN